MTDSTHTLAEDFEHFKAYTNNVPADERLRLAYEHGASRGGPAPVARTCSDERMCINCFSNQGEFLGQYKPATPTDGQIDAITQEWAGAEVIPKLRLDMCREYARRVLKAFPAEQTVARADHCQGPECRDGIRHASDCALHCSDDPKPCDCGAAMARPGAQIDTTDAAMLDWLKANTNGANAWRGERVPPFNVYWGDKPIRKAIREAMTQPTGAAA